MKYEYHSLLLAAITLAVALQHPSDAVSSLFFWAAFAAMSSRIALCRASDRLGLRGFPPALHNWSATGGFCFSAMTEWYRLFDYGAVSQLVKNCNLGQSRPLPVPDRGRRFGERMKKGGLRLFTLQPHDAS
jgi:hypothetical protein